MSESTDNEQETLLEFPCEFPIKVMGKTAEDFDALVVEIILKYVDDLHEGAVSRRLSRNGKYVSITATITVDSKPQLDDIYRELSAHERILMVL